MEAFLQTTCHVCNTPRKTPSRRLPCCQGFVHERCLIDCFHRTTVGQQHICPNCGVKLFPLNEGEESPCIPEGSHIFHFKLVRYDEEQVESPPAEATSRSVEKPQKKRRCNRRRATLRMEAFLQTKCYMCHTPRETPSRRLPCCQVFVHESCLMDCFECTPFDQQHICPNCGVMLFPLNEGQESPCIPEGSHVFHFKLIRYEAIGESPTAEATSKSEEKPQKKKRCRRRRAMLRLEAFLQTKCSICHTPRETPSRPLPCCAKYVHEQCLVACLDYPGSQQQKCPCCGGTLFLLNDGEEFPSQRPEEESRVFLLFHSPHNKIVAELPVCTREDTSPQD